MQQVPVPLPTAEELSVEMILQGMQRAEAAQQQLMSEGKLADAARQGNTAIASLLETHSKLQQLYHKALRALLQQYGQLAVTPAGGWAKTVLFSAMWVVCVRRQAGKCSHLSLAGSTYSFCTTKAV